MNVSIQVQLNQGEQLAKTAQELAAEFLAELGSDPETTLVSVTINESGQAGGPTTIVPLTPLGPPA